MGKEAHLPKLDDNYEWPIFPGSDGSIFWISGTNKDELNIYKQGYTSHEMFLISTDSWLHKYWAGGNVYLDCTYSVPVQLP